MHENDDEVSPETRAALLAQPDGTTTALLLTRKHGAMFQAWLLRERDLVARVWPDRLHFPELVDAAREGDTLFRFVGTKIGADAMGEFRPLGDPQPEHLMAVEVMEP